MGRMSKRSSNRRELRLLGSFRNFAQEVLGSFRKSLASALRLQSSVYEISEIGLASYNDNLAQLNRYNEAEVSHEEQRDRRRTVRDAERPNARRSLANLGTA